MAAVRRKMAKAEGAGIQDEDGIERTWLRRRGTAFPAVEHFLVAAPPDHWKGRPRLRGSLAGGSIRSRRPARESGRNAEWAQIPDSSPPFRAFPWFRSVTAARRATGKLTALWAGASSGRPAEGHRRRWRRVRARWPTRSSRAWRRSDGRSRERCGVRPIPAGLGGCCRNSREAATSPCRRPRTAGRAASPAARGRCPSAGTASCHRR